MAKQQPTDRVKQIMDRKREREQRRAEAKGEKPAEQKPTEQKPTDQKPAHKPDQGEQLLFGNADWRRAARAAAMIFAALATRDIGALLVGFVELAGAMGVKLSGASVEAETGACAEFDQSTGVQTMDATQLEQNPIATPPEQG